MEAIRRGTPAPPPHLVPVWIKGSIALVLFAFGLAAWLTPIVREQLQANSPAPATEKVVQNTKTGD